MIDRKPTVLVFADYNNLVTYTFIGDLLDMTNRSQTRTAILWITGRNMLDGIAYSGTSVCTRYIAYKVYVTGESSIRSE